MKSRQLRKIKFESILQVFHGVCSTFLFSSNDKVTEKNLDHPYQMWMGHKFPCFQIDLVKRESITKAKIRVKHVSKFSLRDCLYMI